MFSDNELGNDLGGGGDDDKDVFSDDELPNLPEFANVGHGRDDDELTDPTRGRAVLPPLSKNHADGEAPTGRFALDGLDDLDDLNLPSAHVSELDVSDLDGDVQEPGAPTAIMQLPPEMMGHVEQANTDSGPHSAFEVRRWSAGGARGTADPRRDVPVPGAPPPSLESPALGVPSSTLPSLSLDAIRAAAEGLHDVAAPAHASAHAPQFMPLPPVPHTSPMGQQMSQTTSLHADDVSRAAPPGALRALVEEALSAVTGAQTAVGGDDAVVERQLSRAVQALSRLLEHVD